LPVGEGKVFVNHCCCFATQPAEDLMQEMFFRAYLSLPPMPDTTGALYLSADAIRQTVERFSRNVKMDEGHSPTRLPFLYRFRGEEP
jgi:hypothetical protein